MTTTEGRKATPRTVEHLTAWRKREQDLLDGAIIPTSQDRTSGHSPFKSSALLDLRQLCTLEIERDQQPVEVLDFLRVCHDIPSADRCWAAYVLTKDIAPALAPDLLWHAAIRGHDAACRQLCIDLQGDRRPYDSVGWTYGCAFAIGLMSLYAGNDVGDGGIDALEIETCRERGFDRLRRLGSVTEDCDLAAAELDDAELKAGTETGMVAALAAMKAAQEPEGGLDSVEDMIAEDRAETVRSTGLRVVAGDPKEKPAGGRADIYKSMKHVIGQDLPLIGTDRLASARTSLHAAYPHMTAQLDLILGTQSALPVARLAILLVSDPGMGKTTVARDIAESLGIPSMVYGCGGASDAAFGGTSAQWNSARACVPMQLIARSKVANPMVVLDEIDKIGTSKHNGSLSDVLLSFLERSSSRAHHDLALEQDVDLSAVSYIATANRLEDVPTALRDRFKIVRIPAPTWTHIGTLSERIISDLARDRGLDRRWIEPLAPDETDLVKKAWPGGSLRRLTRIVTTIVDGREAYLGRA